MKEQIEEMRKDLIEIFDEEYEKRRLITPDFTAEKMTAKGYRKQEWISVEDRLPDKYNSVLIFCEGEVRIDYIDSYGIWHDNFQYRVTHWMPLPEPPKKGGAE